jgi:hypothetical protein
MGVTITEGANSTAPDGTVVETADDPGVGVRQVVSAIVSKGTKAFTKVAPTGAEDLLLAANPDRLSAVFYNNGSVVVYLGLTGVDSDDFPLGIGATFTDNVSTDAWYALAASGTGDIRIIEVSA